MDAEEMREKVIESNFSIIGPLDFARAMTEFAELDGDIEYDHMNADIILIRYLKGLGEPHTQLVREYLKIEYRHGGGFLYS